MLPADGATSVMVSPWMTTREAAAFAKCGPKLIYAAVDGGRLRAARIGAGRNLRFRAEWINAWLDETAVEIVRPRA